MASSLGGEVRVIEGALSAADLRFSIVVSRFNDLVTEPMLLAAVDALIRSGARPEDVTVIRVPGAWELPQTVARVLQALQPDAVIALGCIMRGDTIHFDLIAGEAAKGLAALGIRGATPVVFGVLTTDTLEQALHRAGAKHGNKGAEAAMVAVEQANLYRLLRRDPETIVT